MNQPDNNGFEWDDISSDSQFVVGDVERTEVKKDKKTVRDDVSDYIYMNPVKTKQNKEKKVREKTAQIPTQKTKKDMEKGSAGNRLHAYGACIAHSRNNLIPDFQG